MAFKVSRFSRRHQKFGGKADKGPLLLRRSKSVQLKGTTGCALCSMIGTTPGVFKVPKGAVFDRVKGQFFYPRCFVVLTHLDSFFIYKRNSNIVSITQNFSHVQKSPR